LSPKACRGRESRRVAVAAEDAEVEGELGLQILRALSMVVFLVVFLMFMDLFLLQQRSGGKKWWKSWALDYGGGRFLVERWVDGVAVDAR
jgi:hypothetical protein